MSEIHLHNAAFKSSKETGLQDIKTAQATGFNAAADDYAEIGIDLNEQLIRNKPATFFFRMMGDAMCGAGIKEGDVLIVDRSLQAGKGRIVIAVWEGELLVRRLQVEENMFLLQAANTAYKPIIVNELSSSVVWGVVTYVIHSV